MFEPDQQLKTFGVTVLENLFITEYLPGAKGDHVKVYLTLLYHCQHTKEDIGLEDIAAQLDISVAQAEASLRYWERRRLIERIADNPPRYRLYHLGQRFLTGHSMDGGDSAYISFTEAVYALFGTERKVRPSEIAAAYEWVSDIGLPQETVIMLLSYMKDTRGKNFSFKSAEKMAVDMKEAGVSTPEEAEDFLGHSRAVHNGARDVLRRFNFRRLPTEDELKLYKKWTGEWGFTPDGILSACAETVKASSPSFGYLNGVLEGLMRRGGGGNAKKIEAQRTREKDVLEATKEVLDKLGTRVSPVSVQMAYLSLLEIAPHDMVVLAAEHVSRRRGIFSDIEPQLKEWKEKGIDDAAKARQAMGTPSAQDKRRSTRTVLAQQYTQRDYTEQELAGSTIKDLLKEAQKYDEP